MFNFRLPIEVNCSIQPNFTANQPPLCFQNNLGREASGEPLYILVAEDEHLLLSMYEQFFEEIGVHEKIIYVDTGKNAID